MKLIHYSTKGGDLVGEYVVITEADEEKSRNMSEVVEAFRRDGYEVSGIHDVEPSNNHLPLETELSK